jgi:hypothetical protein
MKPPVCLTICVSPPYLFDQFIDFHEIEQGSHVIQDDFYAIISNPIALTILKWRRFKLLRWMQKLHQSAFDYKALSLVTMVTTIPLLCGN